MGSLRRVVRALGGAFVSRSVRRGLDGVHVRGLDRALDSAADRSVIFAANHVGWWDGMVVVALHHALARRSSPIDGHLLMDADRLAMFPFMAAVGAVPLDRRAPTGLLTACRQTRALLATPQRALWVFPQGEHRPTSARPLGLLPGVTALARSADVAVIPVSIDYCFREAPCPAAMLCFGDPLDARDPELLAKLDAALIAGLDAMHTPRDFDSVIAGAMHVDNGLAVRALSALWRLMERT